MPVQNGMGEPALDFHVCHVGMYAAIETKAAGKRPTPRQLQTMRKVIAAGGSVFVIDSATGADAAALFMWLKFPKPNTISPLAQVVLGEADEPCDD